LLPLFRRHLLSCLIHLFSHLRVYLFFLSDSPTPELYTLSLHDALPIWGRRHRTVRLRTGPRVVALGARDCLPAHNAAAVPAGTRSEEHTSELQSRFDLVCRLLLEKKKRNESNTTTRRY